MFVWDKPPAIIIPAPRELLKPSRKQLLVPAGMIISSGRFGGAASAATNTFITSNQNAANQTTYSFSTISIGTADATRRVVVSVTAFQAGGTQTISSGTIGGVGATIHIQRNNTSGNGGLTGLMSAAVPTGTTATIAVTFSGGVLDCGIGVWRLVNATNSTPDFTASNVSSTTTISTTINVNQNGSLFSSVFFADTSIDTTGGAYSAGATNRFTNVLEGAIYHSGGSESVLGSESNRTVSFNGNNSSAELAIAAMTWT